MERDLEKMVKEIYLEGKSLGTYNNIKVTNSWGDLILFFEGVPPEKRDIFGGHDFHRYHVGSPILDSCNQQRNKGDDIKDDEAQWLK